jgi:hypothetical protein
VGIEPIQFALADMNAHINHDLPLAMVTAPAPLASRMLLWRSETAQVTAEAEAAGYPAASASTCRVQ